MHLRGRQPARDPLDAADGTSRGPDGPLRGQAAEPPERRRLQVRRQHLLHRPGPARAARASASCRTPASTASRPTARRQLVADCEYPNGLAFSPDERVLYVANTRWAQYIHALELDAGGKLVRRRIFADMSSDETDGVPDGMKVDVEGRVYCTGPGRHVGLRARRHAARHHPHAGGPGQPRVRRPRPPDAVPHRPHVRLHAAREGAGPAASRGIESPRIGTDQLRNVPADAVAVRAPLAGDLRARRSRSPRPPRRSASATSGSPSTTSRPTAISRARPSSRPTSRRRRRACAWARPSSWCRCTIRS